MKPLSQGELQNLALELKTLEGSRLQEVKLAGDLLALGLYRDGIVWLVFDLSSQSPQVLMLEDFSLLKVREDKKPIVLFFRAHLLGARLDAIEAPLDLGRVLRLSFSYDRELELRLFPRGANAIVRAQDKKIALHKPQVLKLSTPAKENVVPSAELDSGLGAGLSRSVANEDDHQKEPLLFIKSAEWLGERATKVVSQKSPQNTKEQILIQKQNKIKKSIASIEKDLSAKKNEKWLEAGEWVKANQSLNVPEEYADFINVHKNISFNIENCFVKAKELRKKIEGANERLSELQSQLVKLSAPTALSPAQIETYGSAVDKKSLLRGAQAKGRTHELMSGVTLFIGKSAQDNLRILREAKPWFYWIHLRDEPSAHGVISRNKNQNLEPSLLHKAAQILLESNYGARSADHFGEKYTVILAECRFVRPIKGDRIGRVHYSSEKTFLHLFKNS